MKYRKLGNTQLEVSVLAFGGSSLGGEFGKIDEAEGIRAVHAAIDNGINLLDTAPYYGQTTAETVLGKALREIGREKYYLATKVGRHGKEKFDFSASGVTRSVEQSLARLSVDYVDFIQVHDIEFGNLNQIIHETIPALREVQQQGKARFVGITCLPVKLFRQVMNEIEIDQIQSYCHYALNDTALTEELAYFQEKGAGIFNSAPLAMRLLSNQGPPSWHPAPTELKFQCAQAARFCSERGADIGKLALQYSVANPSIHTNIVGTASSKRILQNIREIEEPLDEELLGGVLEILRPVHNLTWASGHAANN